jgi:hypothetical protein
MEIQIESTTKVVTLEVNGARVPARVWQGHTASGTPVQCFITRIAPEVPVDDPRTLEFARELQEHTAPRATVASIPLRMIL